MCFRKHPPSGGRHHADRNVPTVPSLGRLAVVHFDHDNWGVLHGDDGLPKYDQNILYSQGKKDIKV